MNLSGNTILITGGSSGIGLELCKQLSKWNNTIIICSRSMEKLKEAKKLVPQIKIIQCDLGDLAQCNGLIEQIQFRYPQINILINNAAIVHKINFVETKEAVQMAEKELSVNVLAPINLIKKLYPFLRKKQNANIINITSGLVYVPRSDYPFYCATKAAIHSFTQVLRKQTEKEGVKVTEVFFPAVKTPWHKGHPPQMAITPEKAVSEMLTELQKNKDEIKVGAAKLLYRISRIAPKFAFRKVNSLK